jgi:hypothetical protein
MNTEHHVLFIRTDRNLAFTMCERHPCHVMTQTRYKKKKQQHSNTALHADCRLDTQPPPLHIHQQLNTFVH